MTLTFDFAIFNFHNNHVICGQTLCDRNLKLFVLLKENISHRSLKQSALNLPDFVCDCV